MNSDSISSCEASRIQMTLRCNDSILIPKVVGAGEIFVGEDGSYQLMHNGLKVVSGGYYGDWMRELIQKLRGHHEPQEEKVFHEVVQRASSSGLMIELGCFWAYYSLWFLKGYPDRKAIGVEPDPNHLSIAKKNAYLNCLEDQFTVMNGLSTATSSSSVAMTTETGLALNLVGYTIEDILGITKQAKIEILHSDAQGAEDYIVDQVVRLGINHHLRFCIISTHAYEITGDPLTHQKCLQKLQAAGAHIIAEHDVHESFSGDGLIAASFSPEDKDLVINLTCNRYSEALFPSPAAHLSNALKELEGLRSFASNEAADNLDGPALFGWIRQNLRKLL
jgi:hypothetical protein